MDRTVFTVLLQNEDTRTFYGIRIVFDYDRLRHAAQYIAQENIVCGKLVISMERNTHVTVCDQYL